MIRRFAALSLAALSLAFIAGCGNGGTPPVSVSGNLTFSASGATMTFASTAIGSSAGAQTVTVTNTGNGAITFSGVALTGNNPGDFSMTSSAPPVGCVGITSLAASASCTASVNFTPTVAGTRTATINFQEAGGASHTLTLTGTGTAAQADFSPSPAELDFGVAVVGSLQAAQTLNFQNSGTGADTVSSVLISGTNMNDFAVSSNGCSTVAAGASCAIAVTFTPTGTGPRSATLTVTDNSNGTNGTAHTAALTGNAVATGAPTVTVSPSTLSFTASTPQAVTITNAGAIAVAMNTPNATITGSNASSFSQTNDCGTTIAVGGSCTISVSFAPGSATGAQAATLNIADNVSGSPQTVALTGTASAVESLAPAALSFTEATSATTTAPQTVTLTNSGTAMMSSIATSFTGAGAGSFTKTSAGTCTSTLAAGASCTFTLTFTPSANGQVTAAFSVTSNANNSAQTVALTGYGPGSSSVSMTLVTVPDDTYAAATVDTLPQLGAFINSATSTVDMTIYELGDATVINDMIAACKNGIKVRAVLEKSESANTATYATLNAQSNCSAVYASTHFSLTHEKSVVIDAAIPSKARLLISTGNFYSGRDYSSSKGTFNYYVTGRDFELNENNANDVAAAEATFNSDYANGGTCGGGSKCAYTPANYTPPTGDDLVWSPTNAADKITSVINNATKTLVVDQEEMSSSTCYGALAAAARRGVSVKLTTPNTAFNASTNKMTILANLKAAGVQVNQYFNDPDHASTNNYLYIHAKAIVADYGTPSETAFLGSENCSDPSLTQNRELGIVITDASSADAPGIITKLNTVLTNDNACISLAPTQAAPNCQ